MIATWRKRFAELLLLIATMFGALYFLQDRLLHYPEAIDLPAALVAARDLQLTPWPDASAPRGWLRATPHTMRGTILLFHGNGGHALHRSWYADQLQRHGYRTLLAEYPGYGHRPGSKDEASLAGDAAETLAALRKQFPGPLLLAGESLGAGVAASALARSESASSVTGILLITPWNTLLDVAAHYYPRTLVRLVLRDRYDSVANLAGYSGPKLVLLAGRDTIIPAPLGRALFDSLPPNKKLVEIPDGDHNDWMSAMRPATWREMLVFLEGA